MNKETTVNISHMGECGHMTNDDTGWSWVFGRTQSLTFDTPTECERSFRETIEDFLIP